MASAVSALYEPLIERELDAIPQAVRTFREGNSSDDLFLALGRFAVLAFAPTQHAKHALLAMLSAYDLRPIMGERFDGLLCECATYLAQSRLPWSEPPLLDLPELAADQRRDADELREAIAARDRLRAERWLAARLDDSALETDLFLIASEDCEDLGHKLIIATAATRLSRILGEKGRFAALRVAVWEMVSYAGETSTLATTVDSAEFLNRLIGQCVNDEGSLTSAHAVFLLDAALQTQNDEVIRRVTSYLGSNAPNAKSTADVLTGAADIPIYRLARDYGQCLKAHAVAHRLRPRFPDAALDQFVAACRYNLDHSPSFEEWSFA